MLIGIAQGSKDKTFQFFHQKPPPIRSYFEHIAALQTKSHRGGQNLEGKQYQVTSSFTTVPGQAHWWEQPGALP